MFEDTATNNTFSLMIAKSTSLYEMEHFDSNPSEAYLIELRNDLQ